MLTLISFSAEGLARALLLVALLTLKLTSEISDKVLLTLIGKGREDAFGHLYERYKGLVFSLILKMTGDRELSEEITLDTFERVWRSARDYAPEKASAKTWIVSMARNRAIDNLRRKSSRPDQDPNFWSSDELEQLTDPSDTEQIVTARELRASISAAVRALPDEQQAVLTLAYFGGYTHSEIAQRLNLPLGTVKTRIRMALIQLRERLSA